MDIDDYHLNTWNIKIKKNLELPKFHIQTCLGYNIPLYGRSGLIQAYIYSWHIFPARMPGAQTSQRLVVLLNIQYLVIKK